MECQNLMICMKSLITQVLLDDKVLKICHFLLLQVKTYFKIVGVRWFVECSYLVLTCSLSHLFFQKVIFLHTVEGVACTLRPYWSEATLGRASVVQAQEDMLEIVPLGTSKGSGVKLLLEHLGVTPKEVLAFLTNLNLTS